jgi:hypothetical protein
MKHSRRVALASVAIALGAGLTGCGSTNESAAATDSDAQSPTTGTGGAAAMGGSSGAGGANGGTGGTSGAGGTSGTGGQTGGAAGTGGAEGGVTGGSGGSSGSGGSGGSGGVVQGGGGSGGGTAGTGGAVIVDSGRDIGSAVDAADGQKDTGSDSTADAGGPTCALRIPSGGGAVVNGSATVLLRTGNYCYELWAKLDGSKQSPAYLAACTSGGDCNALLNVRNDLGQVIFAVNAPGHTSIAARATVTTSLNPDDNLWHHIAGCRAIVNMDAGTALTSTLFWDGQLVATATGTGVAGTPTDLRLGSMAYATTDGLGGYIREVRVSNTLRYTARFSPPATFTNDASTVILLRFTGGDSGTFVDSSSNSFSGSLLGTATITCPAP